MKNISTYAHDRGLRFGTYLDAGLATCQGYAGSLGFEEDDARVLASWGGTEICCHERHSIDIALKIPVKKIFSGFYCSGLFEARWM